MKENNPVYVLRNYMGQQAITNAEEGDYSEVDRLLLLLSSPYVEPDDAEQYAQASPEWGKKLVVSCSS